MVTIKLLILQWLMGNQRSIRESRKVDGLGDDLANVFRFLIKRIISSNVFGCPVSTRQSHLDVATISEQLARATQEPYLGPTGLCVIQLVHVLTSAPTVSSMI